MNVPPHKHHFKKGTRWNRVCSNASGSFVNMITENLQTETANRKLLTRSVPSFCGTMAKLYDPQYDPPQLDPSHMGLAMTSFTYGPQNRILHI